MHVESDFFIVGVDADLRKHRCENALQTVHIEYEIEQFVERKTFADVSAVGVLHESLLALAVRISVERRKRFEFSLVGDESVRCACIVVNNQTEVDFDDVRIGHLGVVTSVIAVFRFNELVAVFVVSLALVSCLFVVCEKNELIVASDTFLRFFADCRICVALRTRCNVDVFNAHAECDEFAVNVNVYCDRRVELQVNADGNVEVEFFDDVRNVELVSVLIIAIVVGRKSRNKSYEDVLHNECADFAVRDIENELHLLVRAVCDDFVRCDGRTVLND